MRAPDNNRGLIFNCIKCDLVYKLVTTARTSSRLCFIVTLATYQVTRVKTEMYIFAGNMHETDYN